LIDCDTGNDGCKGGLMTTAYDYIMKAAHVGKQIYIFYFIHNILSIKESDYPYADKKQEC